MNRLILTKVLNYDMFSQADHIRSILVPIDWNRDNDYHGQGQAIGTNGGGSRREESGR